MILKLLIWFLKFLGIVQDKKSADVITHSGSEQISTENANKYEKINTPDSRKSACGLKGCNGNCRKNCELGDMESENKYYDFIKHVSQNVWENHN